MPRLVQTSGSKVSIGIASSLSRKYWAMLDGRIVESGGPELAVQLEEQGYDWIREKYAAVQG